MRLQGYDGRDWETVRNFHRRWEAEMLQGLLDSHGFDTWLVSDDAGGSAYPGVTVTGLVLLVPVEDAHGAREVIAIGGVPTPDGVDTRERLAALLLRLLRIPSVTGEEEALADWLEDRYLDRDQVVRRIGESLVVGEEDFDRPNILLVAHLDTVPPAEEDEGVKPRRERERIVGRGASDMKSGLAVAMDCFEDPALRSGPHNLLLVLYAGEEGSHDGNQLAALLAEIDELSDADLAIVLEPTDLTVQLGCLGGLHARVTFRGRAAHSARPWFGENALTKAGDLLAELYRRAPDEIEVDGLVYREVFAATQAQTSNARNVVPEVFTLNLNYRYAPTRRLTEAEERVWGVVDGRAEVEFVDRAPPALPHRSDPYVAAFVTAVGGIVEPKQAWTDVARFAEAGVAALNYGPGLTAQAHQAGEYVPTESLVQARAALGRFLSGQGDVGADGA